MKNAHELWSEAWPTDMHISEHAQKRLSSAKSAKLTPVKIDTVDLFGYFQGSSGRYETFLDSCPCGDFIRNKKPCKHIYRLAMELGLMDNGGIFINEKMIPIPKKEKKQTLSVLISLLEEGGYSVINEYYSNSADAPFLADPESFETNFLLSNLFWKEIRDIRIFSKLKKDVLVDFLQQNNIVYQKNMKIDELKTYILENCYSEFRNAFPNRIACVRSEDYTAFHKQMHSYCNKVINPYSYLANCELTTNGNRIAYIIPDSELNRLFFEHGHEFDLEVKNNPYIMDC